MNTVHVKIDPQRSSKVITFFMIEANDEADKILQDQRKTESTLKRLVLRNIYISLIDSNPKEIVQFAFKNLELTRYNVAEAPEEDSRDKKRVEKELISITLESLILNNQLIDATFPVVFAPNKRKDHKGKFISIQLYAKNDIGGDPGASQGRSSLYYVNHVSALVDTIEVRFDDILISALFGMLAGIDLSMEQVGDETRTERMERSAVKIYDFKPLQRRLEENTRMNDTVRKFFYIKTLLVQPLEICLTFRSSPGQKLDMNTLNFLTDFGLTLASIDSARLKLNSLVAYHMYGPLNEIADRFYKHYSRQILYQLAKIFGAIDILGNPANLISNISTGLQDIFIPFVELVSGRGKDFTKSLADGTFSFVRHSLKGVYTTVNKIIGTFMQLLATLTTDKDYIQKRHRMKNRTIRSIKEGIFFGFKNFLQVIWGTIAGVIRCPWKEIKKRGCLIGFFTGIYQAAAGIVIKPIVALYDLLHSIFEGLRNSALYEEHVMETRTRPPRIFDENQVLIPYDFMTVMSKDLLRKSKFKNYEGEKIIFYDELKFTNKKKNTVYAKVILTESRFFFIEGKRSYSWTKVKLYQISDVEYKPSLQKIELRLQVPMKNGSKSVSFDYDGFKAEKIRDEVIWAKNALEDKRDGELEDDIVINVSPSSRPDRNLV
eukprot:TRINITY_DN6368_c0_g1_i1.p1 TRINITY_DN6368_c0_g1~~TRINITY_DN6368_c0_g1_i1.p1  ORF type:complete len:660 (-),score=168.22 TRINITY_DN6368_c0_g1_i1:93-2072(-)